MDGITYLVLIWALSVGSAIEPCGPKNVCICDPVSANSTALKMDCSNTQTSICEICSSSIMTNVTYLDASENNISNVSGNKCVAGCKGLRSLNLSNNSITHIDVVVFETIYGLINLDISFNKLNVYTNSSGVTFQNLTHLQTLKINGNLQNHNDGNSLSYPDLSNLTSLVNLTMDGLRDSEFDTTFSGLSNLAGLSLSGQLGVCDLGELHNEAFRNLHQIERLSLSDCNIENIYPLTFALTKLSWLDLSQNKQLGFETLHNVSYGLQFSSIRFLNYSYVYITFRMGTRLEKRDMCYLYNTTLEELALDNNNIEQFEDNVPLLFPPTLKILHGNYNLFGLGPYVFQMVCVENLTELHVNFRNVARNLSLFYQEPRYQSRRPFYPQTICPFMADELLINRSRNINYCTFVHDSKKMNKFPPAVPKSLKILELSNSAYKYEVDPLTVLPPVNVEYLDFSGNTLFAWIGPIKGFNITLKTLNVANNYCTKVSTSFFKDFAALENIQASGNLIGFSLENTSYYGPFNNLENLKVLNLSLNRISIMNETVLFGLKNLESIDFSFNNIEEWNLQLNTLTNLLHVNLSHNSVKKLPEFLTTHLEDVSKRRGMPFSIDLQNNILGIDCDSLSFLKWMVQHRNNCVSFDEYVFGNADNVQMKGFGIMGKIDQLEKQCPSKIWWIVLASVAVSMCMSLMVAGLVYKNRWKLRYFMYMSKRRFYGYVRIPNQEPLENFKYNGFISYAEENLRFVKDDIIPNLEDGDDGVTLCIHQRNSLPGNTIVENIVDAIQSSRKTVVLLTKAYLKRSWCMYEFNMARMENIYNRDDRCCIVIVMLENIQAKEMPLEMLELVKTESCIEYNPHIEDQCVFWDALRDAIAA